MPSKNEPRVEKICAECNKPFTVPKRHKNQECCSLSCGIKRACRKRKPPEEVSKAKRKASYKAFRIRHREEMLKKQRESRRNRSEEELELQREIDRAYYAKSAAGLPDARLSERRLEAAKAAAAIPELVIIRTPEEQAKYEKQQNYEKRGGTPKRKQQRQDDYVKNGSKPSRRFARLKSGAKQRGISVSLTLEEYIKAIEPPCYYCNYELGKPVTKSGGLDRIDPTKGYSADNVISSCQTCNTIRDEYLTVEETKIAVQAVIAYRRKNAIQK